MFWLILFALAGVISLGSIFYLLTRFHKFGFVQKIAENHKKLSWLLCLVPLIGIGCFGIINTYAVVIIVFHLAAFWLIADLIGKIFRKAIKKERRFLHQRSFVSFYYAPGTLSHNAPAQRFHFSIRFWKALNRNVTAMTTMPMTSRPVIVRV